jgi:hypothetical protein
MCSARDGFLDVWLLLRPLTWAEGAAGGWVVAQGKEEAVKDVGQAWSILDMKPRLRRLTGCDVNPGFGPKTAKGSPDRCKRKSVEVLLV